MKTTITTKQVFVTILASASLFFASYISANATSVFTSGQVGTAAANGYVLQTNGTNSTWVATSTLGFSSGGGGAGTVGTSTQEILGYIPVWATTNGSPALLAGTSSLFQLNGNIGIGTTSPSSLLQISASDAGTTLTNASLAMANITNRDTTANNFGDLAFSTADTAGQTIVSSKIAGVNTAHTASAVSGDLAFLTRNAGTFAEKMRILASGSVGIGTTSPTAKLGITGNGLTTGLVFQTTNSSSVPQFNITDNGTVTALTSFGNLNGSSAVTFPSGRIQLVSGGSPMWYMDNAITGSVRTASTTAIGWSSTNAPSAAIDTGLTRYAANIIAAGNGTPGNTGGTFLANTIGVGSTSPFAKLSIHDNSGSIASSTYELLIASSTASNTATTTLFSVDGFGSTTMKGSLALAGGAFRDNNGSINLAVGISGVNKAKCGLAIMDNFAASCSSNNGALFGVNMSNDTNYAGYNSASFQRGSNVNGLNSAGANALFFTAQVNTTNNATAGFWNQTQTTNAINTGTSYAYISQDYLQGTGQLGSYVGFNSRGSYATAGPTVTNQYDFQADPFTSLANGTTTNRYGLYLGYDATSITNPYGVYQLSPAVKNYFAGNTGFGSTSPIGRLTVTGGVGSTTDLFIVSSSSNTQLFNIKSDGKVGLGTTTPAAKLDIYGTAGTDDIFGISSSSNARFLTVASTGGVGIGTSAPSTLLHVYGNVAGGVAMFERTNATTNQAVGTIKIKGTSAGTPADGFGPAFQFYEQGSNGVENPLADIRGLRSGADNSGALTFSTSNAGVTAEAARFTPLGRFGIGTTTPSAILSLAASTTAAGGINFGDAAANLYRSADGTIRTDGGFTAGGGQFIVSSTGSITSSPGAVFNNIYIRGTDLTTIPTGSIGFTSANWYDAADTAISRLGANKLAIGNGTAGDVSGTLIAAKIGVGSSTPAGTALTTNGTNYMTGLTASAGLQTGILCLDANGQVINESVACVASAKRYKTNIAVTTFSLDGLMKLQPVSFDWKKSYLGGKTDPNLTGTQYSLIADDVQKVFPQLVAVTTATTTFEGKTYAPGSVQGLEDTNHWVSAIVSWLQQIVHRQDDQQKQIDELKAQVQALQKQINKKK